MYRAARLEAPEIMPSTAAASLPQAAILSAGAIRDPNLYPGYRSTMEILK
jgi:hypothetical protein